MRIIDAHVHLCRSREQEQLVFPKAGWPLEWYWANPEGVVSYMDSRGISELVTVNIIATRRIVDDRVSKMRARGVDDAAVTEATTSLREQMIDRVSAFNRWACDMHRKEARILAFASADPVLFGEAVIEEVGRSISEGATGVKIHPNICGHFPDHRALWPVYELCQAENVPILTCSSGRIDAGTMGYGHPLGWVPVLKQFPRLRLIMAHFGEGMWDERIELSQQFGHNVWFDISGGLVDGLHPPGNHRQLPFETAARVFRKLGVQRFLFGSDEPAAGLDVQQLAWQVLRLPLSDDEKEKILWRNAAELLGIE